MQDIFVFEAFFLYRTALVYSFFDLSGSLRGQVTGQFLIPGRRDFDVDVDPVQKRPGNLGTILMYLRSVASAGGPVLVSSAGASPRYRKQTS
jgi:hypothetical protein